MRALASNFLLTTLAAALVLLAPLSAQAATVELKDGTQIESDQLYYTYTHLVVVTPDNDMRIIPNDSVKSIDGNLFTRAYWEERPGHENGNGFANGSDGVNGTNAMAVPIDRLMPLKAGTFRRYDLEQIRTTWIRRGRIMERRETLEADGAVRESILPAPAGTRGVNLVEVITERTPDQGMREIRLKHTIDGRADGYYLLSQEVQDASLSPPIQADSISEPPRLWPQTLAVGQTWVVGPFSRLGVGQVTKMEVVAIEAVSVPAGSYPEAYKVVGKGHLFGGTQHLKKGRLVTDHGTIETTTWIVTGIGPVRELSKIHLHQDFFPSGSKGGEIPIVVEEEATRALAEFHLGQ